MQSLGDGLPFSLCPPAVLRSTGAGLMFRSLLIIVTGPFSFFLHEYRLPSLWGVGMNSADGVEKKYDAAVRINRVEELRPDRRAAGNSSPGNHFLFF